MKIFKKIKCKFAVKDEVRLLSLKVIHYPNIALCLALYRIFSIPNIPSLSPSPTAAQAKAGFSFDFSEHPPTLTPFLLHLDFILTSNKLHLDFNS